MKPIPKPVYPCKYCANEYSWPATDLFWSNQDQDWVCDDCWDDRDIEEEKGVCLADEIKKVEANHDAEVIESFLENQLRSACLSSGWNTDSSAYQVSLMLEDYANQLRQKAQETTK